MGFFDFLNTNKKKTRKKKYFTDIEVGFNPIVLKMMHGGKETYIDFKEL